MRSPFFSIVSLLQACSRPPSFQFPLAGRSNSKGARSQRETKRQQRKELRERDGLGRAFSLSLSSLVRSGFIFFYVRLAKFSLFLSLENLLAGDRERRQWEGSLTWASLPRAPRLESVSRTHEPCSSRASLLPNALLLEEMEQQRRRQQRRLATPVDLQATLLLLLQQPHRLLMARDEASCHAGRRTLETEVGWHRGEKGEEGTEN